MIAPKDALDYFAEAPFAEALETLHIVEAIVSTREKYETAPPPPKRRGRPAGTRNKPKLIVEEKV